MKEASPKVLEKITKSATAFLRSGNQRPLVPVLTSAFAKVLARLEVERRTPNTEFPPFHIQRRLQSSQKCNGEKVPEAPSDTWINWFPSTAVHLVIEAEFTMSKAHPQRIGSLKDLASGKPERFSESQCIVLDSGKTRACWPLSFYSN